MEKYNVDFDREEMCIVIDSLSCFHEKLDSLLDHLVYDESLYSDISEKIEDVEDLISNLDALIS